MTDKSHLKPLTSLMMISGRQVEVIALTTYADFTAMTGISRSYISETGNKKQLSDLSLLKPNTLYYYKERFSTEAPLEVPEDRIHFKSHKDKKQQKAQREAERVQQRDSFLRKLVAEDAKKADERVERVAKKLAELDRQNAEWDDLDLQTRMIYKDRAKQIIAVL